ELSAGDDADLDGVVERLAGIAYARADLVERRGEFAVRGGILDVFPPTEQHPVRVEFFGDTVEEIRYFKVADQRSLEVATHGLWAATDVVLCDAERIRARAADLVRTSEEFLAASWAAAATGGAAPIDLGAATLRGIAEVRRTAGDLGLPWWTVTPFTTLGLAG